MLERKLTNAFMLKQSQDFEKARDCYESILNDEFLKESTIDKHMFIKRNAQKNLGETYEVLGNYLQAKSHYTEALKINQADSYLWRKLGLLQYDKFGDMELAKECLEAAVAMMTTLEKRSNKICPILVKLAEISYRQFEFQKSELIVDIILSRSQQDKPARVFALLMKSHFVQLKGDDAQSQSFVAQAQQLQPGCILDELDVIKLMRQSSLAGKKPAIIYDQASSTYVELGGKMMTDLPKFTVTPKIADGFPSMLSSLLEAIATKLDTAEDSLFFNFHQFDCEEFAKQFTNNYDKMKQGWQADFVEFLEKSHLSQDQTSITADQKKELDQATEKQKKAEQAQRRNLRRKMDQMEHKLKQIKLNNFLTFKDQVLPVAASDTISSKKFEEDCSQREIMEFKSLFQSKAQVTQQSVKQAGPDEPVQSAIDLSRIPDSNIIDHFGSLLPKMQGRDVFYVFRNLLRLLVDTDFNALLTSQTAVYAFKMYTAVLKSHTMQRSKADVQRSQINNDAFEQFQSFRVILTMFELSLFNKEVIRQTKSGPIMTLRSQLYNYFEQNEERVLYLGMKQFNQNMKAREPVSASFNAFMVRLFYCMMYYAFEIKSDMEQSVAFHRKLENGKTVKEPGFEENLSLSQFLMKEKAFALGWISPSYRLTLDKVTSFGSLKVKEAQMVRDYDQAVFALKSQDFQALKKDSTAKQSGEHRVFPECVGQNGFYLEQLFNCLANTIAQKDNENAVLQNSEEKIREMWDKMIYTLCRCPFDRFIKQTCHIFSMLTALQFLHKSFYESFVLRRLDFKKLMEEIFERLNTVFNDAQSIYIDQKTDIKTIRQQVLGMLQSRMQFAEPDSYLTKLEVHLLRLFNPEFLQISVNQLLDSQAGESGQIFLRNYFRSLYMIEMLRVYMNYDPAKDANTNLKQVTSLIRCVDKVAQDNFELFIRPYYRLAQFAFPALLYFFARDVNERKHAGKMDQDATKAGIGMMSPQNELTCFLYACINLFFGLKFVLEELNDDAMEKIKRVMIVEQQPVAEETKHIPQKIQTGIFAFTKFAQANKPQVPKPAEKEPDQAKASDQDTPSSDGDDSSESDEQLFGLLLNDARNQVRAQGINQSMKEQTNQSFTLFSGSLLFNQIVADKGKLNINLMANLVHVTDFLSQGRLMKRGMMQPKDLSNCLRLSETLSQILSAHLATLADKCKASKDRMQAIRKALAGSPFTIQSILTQPSTCTCEPGKECFTKSFSDSVAVVVFYLLNMFTHVGLPTSLHQVSKLSLQQRVSTIERMQSLNDLKKLKNLCYIGIQFSSSIDATALFCLFLSQILLQKFNFLNECKLKLDFKSMAEYKAAKETKIAATYAILAAITLPTVALPPSGFWEQTSLIELQKHFFEQLLQVHLSILRGKQYVDFFVQPLNLNDHSAMNVRVETSLRPLMHTVNGQPFQSHSKSNAKKTQMIDNAMLVNDICQKFELLTVDSNDPRGKRIPQQEKLALVDQLTAIYLSALHQAFQSAAFSANAKVFLLSSQQAFDCRQSVHQKIRDNLQVESAFKTVPKSKLSFELNFLEIVLAEAHEYDIESMQSCTTLAEMTRLKNSLKIALDSGNTSGIFENLFKILQKSIAVAIQTRYNLNGLPDQVRSDYNNILPQITKQVLIDKDVHKFMHTQFLANQGQLESQDEVMQVTDLMGEDQYLFDAHNSHCIRKKILKSDISQIDHMDMILHQLYMFGDKLVQLLQNSIPSQASNQSIAQPVQMQTSAQQAQPQRTLDCYKQWLKIKFNHMLMKNLYYEHLVLSSNVQDTQRNQGWLLLSQAMAQTMTDVTNVEDMTQNQVLALSDLWKNASGNCQNNVINGFQGSSWQLLALNTVICSLFRPFVPQSPKKDDNQSHLFASHEYSCFNLSILKFQLLSLQIDLCLRAVAYEPAKDLYKAALSVFKHQKTQTQQAVGSTSIDNRGKFMDSITSFELTKQAYIQGLVMHVQTVFNQYTALRKMLKEGQMNKQRQNELSVNIKNFRAANCINRDEVPQYLKDIFDLFIETHNSKQFLKKHDLINDLQRRSIRMALLTACAVCGPNSEFSDAPVTSKFLDLARITLDDYMFDGITICIKWYLIILESNVASEVHHNPAKHPTVVKQSSKNQEMHKRLSATLEEITKAVTQSVNQLTSQVENAMITN